MDEIQDIASAYYANLPDEKKNEARNLFMSFDSSKDGKVSLREFLAKVDDSEKSFGQRFFKELDRSGDGQLDFKEFVSFCYMVLTGRQIVECNGCGDLLKGVYFTCPECFFNSQNTFDLCLSCYRGKNYIHIHATFLDNYALLMAMRKENDSNDGRTVQNNNFVNGKCSSGGARSIDEHGKSEIFWRAAKRIAISATIHAVGSALCAIM